MSFTVAYQLIHSLSRGEKKKFSTIQKKSVALELYQQLNKIKTLDEQHLVSLRKKYKKDVPDYLITLILKSMRNYESGSMSNQIKALILDAKFLLKKDLYRQCYNWLQKAKQKALGIHNHLDVLEINETLIELYHLVRGRKFFNKKIILDELLKENVDESLKLNEFLEQKNLHHQLLSYARVGFPIKKPEEIKKLKVQFKPPKKTFKSKIAKYHYIQTKHLYYLLIAKYNKAIKQNQKALAWWKHPENFTYYKENHYRYIQALINILNEYAALLIHNNEAENSDETPYLRLKGKSYQILSQIQQSLEDSTPTERNKVLPAYYKACLNVYFATKSNNRFWEIIEELESKYQIRKQFKLTDQFILLTQYIGFYFRMFQFLKCKKWVEEVLEINKNLPKPKKNIEVAIRVLGVFAGFALIEKKNPSIRESLYEKKNLKSELSQLISFLDKLNTEKYKFYIEIVKKLEEILALNKQSKDSGVFKKRELLEELATLTSENLQEYFSLEINEWLLGRLRK